jgi:uncharacterized damage-inducible protein DinB
MADLRTASFMTPEDLLQHWQGHRGLTRRLIQAFPEEHLFSFSVGGMRPFGELGGELLAMAAPMVRGVANGEWAAYEPARPTTRQELLEQWDRSTEDMNRDWATIPPERFAERTTAFGQYEGPVWSLLMYVVDNEIHHRGQGYVYLRALGIEPPPFWER